MANILFLGGPRDGERHEVPVELPRDLMVTPAFSVPAWWEGEPKPVPVIVEAVLYTLRTVPGVGRAYVAPGWQPPPPTSCVVPDCTKEARIVFTAAERGRLAGRGWEPGDRIALCVLHGVDVYRAQGVYGVDQLAEWLRPDARPDLLDVAGIGSGFGAEEYAASAAHALRVRP